MTDPSDDDATRYGPPYPAAYYFHDGIELASFELDHLEPDFRASVERAAKSIVTLRKKFALSPHFEYFDQIFTDLWEDSWCRFAAEIELGREGVDRAEESLGRFLDLRPVFTTYRLDQRASRYLAEAIETYLFGFDPACIAFCGATLEQVLREAVLTAGLFTEPQLKRERPSALTLLEVAKRAHIIGSSYDAAKRLMNERNRVMHQHLWEDKILRGMARQAIESLSEVLARLDGD